MNIIILPELGVTFGHLPENNVNHPLPFRVHDLPPNLCHEEDRLPCLRCREPNKVR